MTGRILDHQLLIVDKNNFHPMIGNEAEMDRARGKAEKAMVNDVPKGPPRTWDARRS
jgi:hypothetical protein